MADGLGASKWASRGNQPRLPAHQAQKVTTGYRPNFNNLSTTSHHQNLGANVPKAQEFQLQTPQNKSSGQSSYNANPSFAPHLQIIRNSTPESQGRSFPAVYNALHSRSNVAPPTQTFIPHHLRGFNYPSNAGPGPGPSMPQHGMPISANFSQGTVTPVASSPLVNNSSHQQAQMNPIPGPPSLASFVNNSRSINGGQHQQAKQTPTQGSPTFAPQLLKVKKEPMASPVQPPKSADEAFLSYLNKKVAAAAEAKKKDIAEKARLSALPPPPVKPVTTATPWPTPSEDPYIQPPSRPKVVINAGTDKAFQDFLTNQINGPITNGKKYTLVGSQHSLQTVPVASKEVVQGVPSLQVQVSNKNASAYPFGAVDPHSAFSPGNKAAYAGPNFMFNDAVGVDALVEPGYEPQDPDLGFEDRVSDSGIGDRAKENVRASQGQDPSNEFLDWDGKSWRPPPVDWETDRGTFDNSFMPKYIMQDWVPSVPRGSEVEINTKDPKFELALSVAERGFQAPIEHPMTIPDLANSENQEKQRNQTADITSKILSKRMVKKAKVFESWAHAPEKHILQVVPQFQVPQEHPYKPKLDVYLRPATLSDAEGIADIYNHYVSNSIVTEDQAPIELGDAEYLIKHQRDEQLPIIVAVKGKMPSPTPESSTRAKKIAIPHFEKIIGFALAETYAYGLKARKDGRSRFTANLQFYVHPEYTRKKVGQSLLDRLIQTLSHGYGARDGYDWTDPHHDPVYKPGGVQKWHQLVVQYTIEQKNDPNHQWMKNFLRRYFFDEQGCIHSIARTSTEGNGGRFANIVFFCKEASADMEFPRFL